MKKLTEKFISNEFIGKKVNNSFYYFFTDSQSFNSIYYDSCNCKYVEEMLEYSEEEIKECLDVSYQELFKESCLEDMSFINNDFYIYILLDKENYTIKDVKFDAYEETQTYAVGSTVQTIMLEQSDYEAIEKFLTFITSSKYGYI